MFFFYERTMAGWQSRKQPQRPSERRADVAPRELSPAPENLNPLPLEHAGLSLAELERLYPRVDD